MRYLTMFAVAVLGFNFGPAVSACTVDRYGPYDPTRYPANLVIGGTVVADGLAGGEPFAEIQVNDVFVGAFTETTFRLKWWVYDGGGRCSPPGPDVKAGQQVLIYLSAPDGEPMGWVPVHRMGTPMPTVRDTIPDQLLARLSKEAWFKDVSESQLDTRLDITGLREIQYRIIGSDAELRKLVLMDQDAALLRERRRSAYFSAGGALSDTDPTTWVTAAELKNLKSNRFDILVGFDVSARGRVENCTSGHVKESEADDLAVCRIIEERVRLVPPLFIEETRGYLTISWH